MRETQNKCSIEKTKIFIAGAADSTSSHATDEEPSWNRLIEIQFTRPCSSGCLSQCTGLVTLQTRKQMPNLPGQSYFNVGSWEAIIARSLWRSTGGAGGGESLLCNPSVSCQFSLLLFNPSEEHLLSISCFFKNIYFY